MCVVPGYALLPRDLPRRLKFPFVLFVSVAVTSVLGLILLMMGRFNLFILAVLEIPFLYHFAKNLVSTRLHVRKHAGVVILFIAVGCLVWSTTGEPFQASGDSGVYTIAALHLKDTGRWHWDLSEILPDDVPREIAVRTTGYANPWEEVAPGFIVKGNRVYPQFFPLYPLWMAIMASAGGISTVLWANLLGLLLLMTAFYTLSTLFLPRPFPAVALIVLVCNPVLILYAKYATAEMFLAGLTAGWLLSLVLLLKKPDMRNGLAAGVLLGLMVLVKFFPWALAAIGVLYFIFQKKEHIASAAISLVPFIPAVFICVYFSGPHLKNHLLQIRSLGSFGILAGLPLAFILIRLFWKYLKPVVLVLAVVLTAAAWLYMGFIMPSQVEKAGENNFLEFTLLSGHVLITISIIGLLWFLGVNRKRWQLILPFVFILISCYLFSGSGDNPLYPFAARRLLPLTIPLSCLFFAYGLARFRRLGSIVVTICLLAAVVPPLVSHAKTIPARGGEGLCSLITRLDTRLPGNRTVLALPDAWFVSAHLLMSGRAVPCVDPGREGMLEKLLNYVNTRDTSLLLTSEKWPLVPVDTFDGSITSIIQVRTPPIRDVSLRKIRLFLYELTPKNLPLTRTLDVGGDDLLRTARCYAPEKDGYRSFRWTQGHGYFLLAKGSHVRFEWSPGGNPEKPLPVRVWCRGTMVADLLLGPGWQVSPWFELPEGVGAFVVEIRTHTFQPAESGGSDFRNLGVQVSTVETR